MSSDPADGEDAPALPPAPVAAKAPLPQPNVDFATGAALANDILSVAPDSDAEVGEALVESILSPGATTAPLETPTEPAAPPEVTMAADFFVSAKSKPKKQGEKKQKKRYRHTK